MNIKIKIIKAHLELLRSILIFLLNFRKPTDKLVLFCSQKLDKSIIKYYKINFQFSHDKITSLSFIKEGKVGICEKMN